MRAIALCLMCFGLLIAQNTSMESTRDSVSTEFVQDYDELLVPKTKEFIDRLGAELLSKTGFLLKVVVVEDSQRAIATLPKNLETDNTESLATTPAQARQIYKQYLQEHISTKPYTMIVMYAKDQQIEFVPSDREVFDRAMEERVYFEYMVPLLPKRGEFPTTQHISAIMLNGYSEAADLIAMHYGTHLELNIPRDESGGKEFVKISMLTMLAILFGVLGFVYITSRFVKK